MPTTPIVVLQDLAEATAQRAMVTDVILAAAVTKDADDIRHLRKIIDESLDVRVHDRVLHDDVVVDHVLIVVVYNLKLLQQLVKLGGKPFG